LAANNDLHGLGGTVLGYGLRRCLDSNDSLNLRRLQPAGQLLDFGLIGSSQFPAVTPLNDQDLDIVFGLREGFIGNLLRLD
jgi:hypothetical protein